MKNKNEAGFKLGKKNTQKGIVGVIGLGRFGSSLAENLAAEGVDIIVVDKDQEKINAAANYCENAYKVDNLTRETLERIGIGQCTTVIVGIGRQLDVSVLTVLNLKNIGIERVIAKATSAEQGMVLEKLGAEVVYPERDMGERLAGRLARPNIIEYLSLGGDIDIVELVAGSRVDKMKVSELSLRGKFSLNMIAISRGGEITAEIGPNTQLAAGDHIMVIGRTANIEAFGKWLEK